MASTATSKSVTGSWHSFEFAGDGALSTIQNRARSGYAYWCALKDGELVVCVQIGNVSVQLDAVAAEQLGLTIATVAAEAQAHREPEELAA